MEEMDTDALGALIQARYEAAKTAKQPHHNDMVDCLNLMNSRSLTPVKDKTPDIVMDISSPIVKNITGLIRDVFGSSAVAAPYTINATPVVDLPEDVESEMLSRLQAELEYMLAASGGDVAAVKKQISEQRSYLLLEENKRAALAAERMTTIIADRLHDANWENEFIQFIENFVIYPAAIMKCPAVNEVVRPRWNGSIIENVREVVRQVEAISPFDFYPAPFAQDIQSAEYVIERRRMTRNELRALRDAAGYSVEAIESVLEDNPNGAPLLYGDNDPAVDTYSGDMNNRDVYDAIGYYGTLRNDLLADYGIEFSEDEMTGASEAEVWVVGSRVIKCLLNPSPVGKRPFYKASFERVPGAFWGQSPAMKLRDVQKVCTASIRALVRNMQYSSGPMGEVEYGRVKDGLDPAQIIPNTIRMVTDDNGLGNNSPAYRFYTVPSLSGELTAMFDHFHNYAYEVIGIPRMTFGGTQGIGTVGRTSGGLSIIMNQSTKALKHALRMLEKGVIEPVVQDFIDYELRTSTDASIRGDIRVYAKGVSGLIEQENKNGDLEWALQSISSLVGTIDPTTQQPIVPAQAVLRLLYQLFKNKGLSTEGIFPDFDKQAAMGEMLGSASIQPLADLPKLDGRSAYAANTLQAINEGL